jgi:hypothetical protein
LLQQLMAVFSPSFVELQQPFLLSLPQQSVQDAVLSLSALMHDFASFSLQQAAVFSALQQEAAFSPPQHAMAFWSFAPIVCRGQDCPSLALAALLQHEASACGAAFSFAGEFWVVVCAHDVRVRARTKAISLYFIIANLLSMSKVFSVYAGVESDTNAPPADEVTAAQLRDGNSDTQDGAEGRKVLKAAGGWCIVNEASG